MSVLLIIIVVVVLSLSMGFAIDRATWIERLPHWPIKGMPGTNGVIFGLLFFGALLLFFGALPLGLGVLAKLGHG